MMKFIRSKLLDFSFAFLFVLVAVLSALGFFYSIDGDYGKRMPKSEISFEYSNFSSYMKELKMQEDAIVFIVINQNNKECYDMTAVESLKSFGFSESALIGNENGSCRFIGIWNGNVLHQIHSFEKNIKFSDYINNRYCYISCSSPEDSKYGVIYIDDFQYSISHQGINVVVIDNERNEFIDSICYDVFSKDLSVYRIV